MEYVEGVGMNELDRQQRTTVEKEVEKHLDTMRKTKSKQ
jgi:hypothetical protein